MVYSFAVPIPTTTTVTSTTSETQSSTSQTTTSASQPKRILERFLRRRRVPAAGQAHPNTKFHTSFCFILTSCLIS